MLLDGGSEQDLKKEVVHEVREPEEKKDLDPGPLGHSRNNSYASQHSKASGYSSAAPGSHSRQSSSGEAQPSHHRYGVITTLWISILGYYLLLSLTKASLYI